MKIRQRQTVRVTDLQNGEHQGIPLNGYTLEEIQHTVDKYGAVSIPKTVIDVIADIRNPQSNYGVLATQKFLLTEIGVWDVARSDGYNLCNTAIRRKGLIFLSVFEGLERKEFNTYCNVIRDVMGADMNILADTLSHTLNLPIQTAHTVIDIILYLHSYNGFIMEYMVSEMVSKNVNTSLFVCRDGVSWGEGGEDSVSQSILDKEWGIDLLIGDVGEDIQLPLQLKSFTHLGKNRTALAHTFKAHRDFKRKYNGLIERESKGNVYFLHYSVDTLSLTVPTADFLYSLPQSRELESRTFDTSTLQYNRLPIWEVCYLLEGLVEEIREGLGVNDLLIDSPQNDLIQFI